MARRLLCLYFPQLPLDRLQREDPVRCSYPFAVTYENRGHTYIAAANALAGNAGIVAGARLADARTILPTLQAIPDDPLANAHVKQRLVQWCNRYSPLVANDGPDGIAIDITGCAHLFGGEAALLTDLQARIRKTGYHVRGAIADSLGAAWAFARYSKRAIFNIEEMPAALDLLPVQALRLSEETVRALRRVGLTTIGAVRKIPRQLLATRFGSGILLRLDQAFCHAEEPIVPYCLPAPYYATRTLAEPISTVSAVEYVLLDLLNEICSRLEKDHMGARQLNLDCCRIDGTVVQCCVATAKPVRSIEHLMCLFSEKLDGVDAGFGIETITLSISRIDRLDPEQIYLPEFSQYTEKESELDRLVDRLGMRLGFQKVCRFQIRESLLPENAIEFQPITAPVASSASWPESRVRPVCLIHPPARIQVWTVFPDETPVQFRLRGTLHSIAKAEGPERLTPEWWRDDSWQWAEHDYYRIEDDKGARFWIFREVCDIPRSTSLTRWFLCGYLS
jgi:protein ImuB